MRETEHKIDFTFVLHILITLIRVQKSATLLEYLKKIEWHFSPRGTSLQGKSCSLITAQTFGKVESIIKWTKSK